MTTSRSKDIAKVLKALEKAGTRKPGKRTKDIVPTGLIGFDRSVGGGLVRGRIYELAGNQSTGKTTFAFECIKAFQSLGEYAAFIDFEHALDLDYAAAVGVSTEEPNLLFEQPTTLESGLGVGYELIKSGAVGIVVVDSVAGMMPESEAAGKKAPAQQARAFGPEVRKYISLLAETNTVGLFINQTRVDFNLFASGITTPGGSALKFFSSVRMFMTAGKSKVYDDGIHSKIRIWKNKQSPDQRGISEYEIRPMLGIIRAEEVLAIGKEKGLITDRAGIFKVRDKTIRGREKMLEILNDEKMKDWIINGKKEEEQQAALV